MAASMAVVENDQAGAHGSSPPLGQPAHLDLFDDDREAQSVIERVGDPTLAFGDVAEVHSSMVVSDRTLISRMVELAHELKGVARLDEPIDVAPAVHAGRRRAPEFRDATWVGAHARLSDQRERIGASLPLAILLRQEPWANPESVNCGHRDQWPREQRAPESVNVPWCQMPPPDTGG
jgi:hypothetical protein